MDEVVIIFKINEKLKKKAKTKAFNESKTLKQYLTDLIIKDLKK